MLHGSVVHAMTPNVSVQLPRIGGWLLRAAFAGIIAAFAAISLVGVSNARSVYAKNRSVMESSFTNIELVWQLERDLNREKLLLDDHIFESEEINTAEIEGRLAMVQEDYAVAARTYDVSAKSRLAEAAWQQQKEEVAAIRRGSAQIIELSRRNDDLEARKRLVELEPRFDSLDMRTTELLQATRQDAEAQLVELGTRQRTSIYFLDGLAIIGSALGVVIAIVVLGMVARREEELTRTALLLHERNRDLDAFAGRVAHDLRGPLTTINFTAARLSARAPDEAGTTAVLRRAVTRMETLIRDLLALSRIGAETRLVASDPCLTAAAVAEEMAAPVEAAGGTLTVTCEHAVVVCSDGLLHQALWNLVDNSLKYRRSDAPPKIAITGRVADDAYELLVSDNGIGMSAESARQAFEPFFRAREAAEAAGTGLGLSIVKRVVEAAGGKVSVESIPEQGTTFTIRLPLANREG